MRLDSQDALLERVDQIVAERRRVRLSGFEDEDLAWLALPPVWPEELARATRGPGRRNVGELLVAAEAAGLCARREVRGSEGGSRSGWFMDPERRREMQEEVRSRRGPGYAAEVMVRIAERISQEPLPESLQRWARLASSAQAGGAETGRELRQVVEELVDPAHPESSRTGQALAWVETAKELAPVLGGELESAAGIARRRIELVYRRAQDVRHLTHFQERGEQVRAFRELLEDEGGAWALHYLGMGGVGKTMLLRHLMARVAPEAGVLTTRVDFDHLSPDYPVRRPGQLVLELAEELRAFSESSIAEKLFDEFGYRILSLHEAMTEDPTPDSEALRDPRFERVLGAFCDVLTELKRPVVFILDTCEELAKLHPTGVRVPALEATFELIERVHQAVPTTHIVFAGRRPLARGGHGWELEQGAASGLRGAVPDHKPYLRLHLIRGFNADEANRYLKGVPSLADRPEMRAAVLERSPDVGTPPGFPEAPGPEERYNPFDLGLYADWIREDPDLDVDVIEAGHLDPYVEVRILRRVETEPGVRGLLPAAVLLRRFDDDALRPAFDGDDEAYETAFGGLAEQEWIDYRVDQETRAPVLEVDRNLLPRLESYYGHPDRSHLLRAAAERLAPALAQRLRDAPPESLTVDVVDAALRVLPPAEGGTLFHELTLRVAEEARWEWAANVAARLLGDEGAAGDAASPLRAVVRAFHNAATVHRDPAVDLVGAWQEVAETWGRHPDPEVGRWLAIRAWFGVFDRWKDGPTPRPRVLEGVARPAAHPELEELDAPLVEQLLASAVGALDRSLRSGAAESATGERPLAWLVAGERPLGWRVEESKEWIVRALSNPRLSPGLRAAATVLLGRLHRLPGSVGIDRADPVMHATRGPRLEHLADVADGCPEQAPVSNWMDWAPPPRLRESLRLQIVELLRLAAGREFGKGGAGAWYQRLREWVADATGASYNGGGDRLAAGILAFRLDRAPVPREELEVLERWETYSPGAGERSPEPPLFVRLAEAWTVLGDAGRAENILRTRAAAAARSRVEAAVVRHAAAAELARARRFRLQHADTLRTLPLTDTPGYEYYVALALPAGAGDRAASELTVSAPAWSDEKSIYRTRLAALRALEFGELVALGDPSAGRGHLSRATAEFESVGDDFGAFQTLLVTVLAAARGGDRDRARTTLEEARAIYERLPGRIGTGPGESPGADVWPAWDDLCDLDHWAESRQGFPLGPGWYDRLALACRWAEATDGSRRSGPELDAVEHELRELHGGLPTELDVFPRDESDGRGARGVEWLQTARALELGALPAVGWAILAGAFYLGARQFGFTPGLAQVAGGVLIAVALVALAALLPTARRFLRWLLWEWASLSVSRSRLDGRVWAASAGVVRVTLRVQTVAWKHWLATRKGLRQQSEPEEVDADAVARDPQAAARELVMSSAQGGSHVARVLRLVSRALRRGHADLALTVDGPVAAVPWEAFLGHVAAVEAPGSQPLPGVVEVDVRQALKRWPLPLHVYRVAESPWAPAGRTWQRRQPVRVLTGDRWRGAGEQGWMAAGHDAKPEEWPRRSEVEPGSGPRSHLVRWGDAGQVLHVIAAATTTTAGPRLRLDLGRDTLGTLVEGAKATGPSLQDEDLVAPEDLPRTWLTVLQAEPTSELALLGTDREQLGELRQVAARLADDGAPAVLVLPPLPSPLAAAAVQAFAGVLPRWRKPTPRRLAEGVARAQAAIVEVPLPHDLQDDEAPGATDMSARTRRELALEITLYVHRT